MAFAPLDCQLDDLGVVFLGASPSARQWHDDAAFVAQHDEGMVLLRQPWRDDFAFPGGRPAPRMLFLPQFWRPEVAAIDHEACFLCKWESEGNIARLALIAKGLWRITIAATIGLLACLSFHHHPTVQQSRGGLFNSKSQPSVVICREPSHSVVWTPRSPLSSACRGHRLSFVSFATLPQFLCFWLLYGVGLHSAMEGDVVMPPWRAARGGGCD